MCSNTPGALEIAASFYSSSNKVGDLMSRLSSDTNVVGKSITHNLNSGLSSAITGAGGLAFMIWTSPQLTGLLLLMFPPIAIGSLIYGKAVKNISSSIQRSQGSLSIFTTMHLIKPRKLGDHTYLSWNNAPTSKSTGGPNTAVASGRDVRPGET
ncbi:ATP-dependent permease MDL2 [Akanthomyces lecanii RCEF 1005]|uniref:ATP-dependent permease MDL2 n=1 Tax=Akanthomyces lecanii RCEF 1005 TaxID=1081108 RepID=A0A162LGB0_CORDF|nr:ATP-dependent permease MDL2 [Akanthomyces lecanii RCEF 1005]